MSLRKDTSCLISVGRIREAQPVLDVALVLAQLLGQLAQAVAVLGGHALVHERFVERREVLPLEVLDDGDLERRLVVDLLDDGRDLGAARRARGAPAPLTGDELVACRRVRGPDQDRLEDAVLA